MQLSTDKASADGYSLRMSLGWLFGDETVPGEPLPTEQLPLSFASPKTHFRLVRGREGACGGHINEPTGEIECLACGARHDNIDDIPHESGCPQRFVHSEYYLQSSRRGRQC